MSACGFRGSDGEIKIDGNVVTMVTWEVTIDTSIITSPRIGKVADMKCPGKQDVNGNVEQVLVTPDLLAMVMGDSTSQTVSSFESLFGPYAMNTGVREEAAITPNPTLPTNVKITMTAGDNATLAGSIVIHGTNSSDKYITEVISLSAMDPGDPAQIKYGTQVFKTTTFVDIEATLGVAGTTTDPTLTLDGTAGTKVQSPGNSTLFDISGEVTDGTKSIMLTLTNCFFTSGNFPIGDSNTLVACSLPFTVTDADIDFTLSWTA